MYKVISKSRLPVTITIVDYSGNSVPITLPKFGSTVTKEITSSIKNYQLQGTLVVRLDEPKPVVTDNREKSGISETIKIRKFNGASTITSPSIDWEGLFNFLDNKDFKEIKQLATSLEVNYGSNIRKVTLINRLLDQKTNEILKLAGLKM